MSKEKVVIVHEDEAATLYNLVVNRLKQPGWDLHDEEQWSEASMLKQLEEKLRAYLDNGQGKDVREV